MGDTSVMARRLADGRVQYGWSGNGGYFASTGIRLLYWYTESADVDYLFGLGQTGLIGTPGSEKGGESAFFTHRLTGEPCDFGTSEQDIFSKLMFVDYAYFYDIDHNWYYISPSVLRIKIPIELIQRNWSEKTDEFAYLRELRKGLLRYMLLDYPKENLEFAAYLSEHGFDPEEVLKQCLTKPFPLSELRDHYLPILQYFDPWVLAKPNDAGTSVEKFILRRASSPHVETCDWENEWIRKRPQISYEKLAEEWHSQH